MKLNIRPLTPELWSAFEELFGKQGACNGRHVSFPPPARVPTTGDMRENGDLVC